jgi:hypothetical protein
MAEETKVIVIPAAATRRPRKNLKIAFLMPVPDPSSLNQPTQCRSARSAQIPQEDKNCFS